MKATPFFLFANILWTDPFFAEMFGTKSGWAIFRLYSLKACLVHLWTDHGTWVVTQIPVSSLLSSDTYLKQTNKRNG